LPIDARMEIREGSRSARQRRERAEAARERGKPHE
jgi:hypothetical protein